MSFRARVRQWGLYAVVLLVACLTYSALDFPAVYVFGGVTAGAVCALTFGSVQKLHMSFRNVAIGIVGVTAGSRIDSSVVGTLSESFGPILSVVTATLLLSTMVGQILRFNKRISGITATLSSVAGGASGLVLIAKDLGADERIVLTVQYLRVLVVLATIPLIVPFFESTSRPPAAQVPSAHLSWDSLLFTLTAFTIGCAIARFFSASAMWLIMPMIVAASLSYIGLFSDSHVPMVLSSVAFVIIGTRVGLELTRETLRLIRGLLPLALIQVATTIGICAGLGFLLAEYMGLSHLDGYLATTPGGLPAVTAIALGSGADIAFVLTIQIMRIVFANIAVPLIVSIHRRWH